jgi:hypothetical protein
VSADLKLQFLFPIAKQFIIHHQAHIRIVVGDIGAAAHALHPIIAGAQAGRCGRDIDEVRPCRRPIVTGAFAVVVLPGRTEALRQLAGRGKGVGNDGGVLLEERLHLQIEANVVFRLVVESLLLVPGDFLAEVAAHALADSIVQDVRQRVRSFHRRQAEWVHVGSQVDHSIRIR